MFVVKLVISTLIVVICSIVGIRKAKKYETRERILQDFIAMFNAIENDIKYMSTSLPDAFDKVRHGLVTSVKDTLGAISVIMMESSDIDDMNRTINEEINNIAELNSYDKEVIYQGISTLGKADTESQISIIKTSVVSLENQLKEATDLKSKNFKLYRTLGTAVGLMIAIVFI